MAKANYIWSTTERNPVVKKIFFISMAAILCLSAGAGNNLFPNGDFAETVNKRPAGWSGGEDRRLAVIDGGVNPGGKVWKIKAGADEQVLTAPVISGKFSGNYTFKGFYQATEKSNLAAEFTLQFLNSKDEVLLTRTQNLPSTQDEWIAFFDQYAAPEGSTQVQVKIIVKPGNRELKLSNFSLRAGTLKDYAPEFSAEVPKGKKRFPVFGWVPPGSYSKRRDVSELYGSTRIYAEYSYANHSVYGDPAFNSLRVVKPNISPEDAKNVSDAWVIMGKDEPTPIRFPGLLEEKARLEKILPDVPYFNNLLPCYVSKKIIPDHDAYLKYLTDYRDKFKPRFVTMDYYCLHTKPPIYARSIWNNLYDMQKVFGNTGTDWGIILAVLHFGSNRSPSEAELRWQVYCSLAYGAKIIGWFTFLQPIDRKLKPAADAPIQRDGNRSFHYAMLRKINREILQLGPTLLKLKSKGTFHSPVMARQLYSYPVKEGNMVSKVSGGQAIVGEFIHKDNGKAYFILSNRDFMKSADFELTFAPDIRALREVSKVNGELKPREEIGSGGVFKLKLAAGDGRLYELEQK